MAWRIVRQPNGKYARWSDVVDAFTHVDMTTGEAVAVCRWEHGMAEADADKKVAAAGAEPGRWADCLRMVGVVHGPAAVPAFLAAHPGVGVPSVGTEAAAFRGILWGVQGGDDAGGS